MNSHWLLRFQSFLFSAPLLHLLSLCSCTLSPVIFPSSFHFQLHSLLCMTNTHTHPCSCGCLLVGAEAALCAHRWYFAPWWQQSHAAALSSSEQYKSWTVCEGKKNQPGVSHAAVMTVCVWLSLMYVWSGLSDYASWAGDAAVCEDHYPGLICQYCNAAESDVCSRKFSVCL